MNFLVEEQDFHRYADSALEDLKQRLLDAEGSASSDFEVDERNGAIHVEFDDAPARFVISSNSSARQIWIAALGSSWKLDWSEQEKDFVLEKTGETLKGLISRLLNQQLGRQAVDFTN